MDGSMPSSGAESGLSRRRFILTGLTAAGGMAIGFGPQLAHAASVTARRTGRVGVRVSATAPV